MERVGCGKRPTSKGEVRHRRMAFLESQELDNRVSIGDMEIETIYDRYATTFYQDLFQWGDDLVDTRPFNKGCGNSYIHSPTEAVDQQVPDGFRHIVDNSESRHKSTPQFSCSVAQRLHKRQRLVQEHMMLRVRDFDHRHLARD